MVSEAVSLRGQSCFEWMEAAVALAVVSTFFWPERGLLPPPIRQRDDECWDLWAVLTITGLTPFATHYADPIENGLSRQGRRVLVSYQPASGWDAAEMGWDVIAQFMFGSRPGTAGSSKGLIECASAAAAMRWCTMGKWQTYFCSQAHALSSGARYGRDWSCAKASRAERPKSACNPPA